ncbi:MAG: DUF2203 domain-containing protein [Actinobacteria bacterium]|nr:DUF2203 domain-containing protein [Actinomycetota bacterium]
MAGQQFAFTPPRPSPSQPKRRFTLEQANRSLPLVKRVAADIVKCHAAASQAQSALDRAPAKEKAAAQKQLDAHVDRLQDLMEELSEVGCEIKDFRSGLLDFIARHQSRDVYLCWKLGEERIAFWHELGAGYTGRQPISKFHETQ